jgi:uncharacterized protein (DUF779 family)
MIRSIPDKTVMAVKSANNSIDVFNCSNAKKPVFYRTIGSLCDSSSLHCHPRKHDLGL